MTTMKQLTDKLATEGGCIVASADCDIIELADARVRGDFTVDDVGIGYVRRLPGWLRRHSRFARGATDSCEQRADEEAEPVAYAEFADNRCVRMWSLGYEERLPGTRMVPLYTHAAQAQPPAAKDAEVYSEIDRATAKFPTWPTDPLHAVSVLGEEYGELVKATLQHTYEPHKSDLSDVREEAVQTAAMALRFVRSIDRYEFARCKQHSQTSAMTKESGNG